MKTALRFIAVIFALLILTLITQIGGIVLLGAIGVARFFRRRVVAAVVLFLLGYTACSLLIVPPMAAIGGRVPLPCAGEPLRTLPIFCALNRHYVKPPLRTLVSVLAQDLAAEVPSTVTVALDANFPFLDGFPLLPHLSHDDGVKLDLAFAYANDERDYVPGVTRSPIGYWAFEQPSAGEGTECPETWLTARWDMDFLQPLFPALSLEPVRTRATLRWLATNGAQYGLSRVFIEPHLARRFGVSSPLLGFQGCRAARHDDHIHIEIAE